jgi:hypothetical protein
MTLDRKKYTEELDQMQEAKSVPVELCPLDAVAIITHVQLVATNTGDCKITQIAIAAARKIQETVLDPQSTAYEILEAGWGAIKN